MDMIPAVPKTENQKKFMDLWESGTDIIFQLGVAGSGKSFLSLYCMMKDMLENNKLYDKIIIIRSAVEVRSQGFLKGSLEEKQEVYELPYEQIVDEMFKFNHSYQNLKALGKIEFMTTSFIRGLTFDKSLIFVDESTNMDLSELDAIISRTGVYSRLVFAGDIGQNDLARHREKTGLPQFIEIAKNMEYHGKTTVGFVEYTPEDIVRSGICRDYIVTKHALENATTKRPIAA